MDKPTDLYQDMQTLNSLYEELMWDTTDALEFVADYENDRIIIRNKSKQVGTLQFILRMGVLIAVKYLEC